MVRDGSADPYVEVMSAGRPQPPGWYQDPGRPGQLRYWTGAGWTAQVAPAPPQAPPAAPPQATVAERRRGLGCLSSVGLAAAALVLAAVVIAIALLRGQDVKSVDASGKVEFYSTGGQDVKQEDVQKRQSTLERELAGLKDQAQKRSGTTQPAAVSVDLTGTWQCACGGTRYAIQQYGSAIVIQEMTVYGITAIGQGTVTGQRLELQYQAYNGITGTATLDLVSPGVLQGFFRNPTYGQLPATLTKL